MTVSAPASYSYSAPPPNACVMPASSEPVSSEPASGGQCRLEDGDSYRSGDSSGASANSSEPKPKPEPVCRDPQLERQVMTRRLQESLRTPPPPRRAPPRAAAPSSFTPRPASGVTPPPPRPPGATVPAPTYRPPVHMTAIGDDKNDGVLNFEHSVTPGSTRVGGVKDMVDQAIAKTGGRKGSIGSLRISDHASPGSQSIGKDVISTGSLKPGQEVHDQLVRLKPYLKPGATVYLEGCNVADGKDGEALARELSDTLGVKVVAPTMEQAPVPGIEGPAISCSPGAGCTKPPEPTLAERVYQWGARQL